MRLNEEVQSKMTLLKVKDRETFQVVLRLLGKLGLRKKKSESSSELKSILFTGLLSAVLVTAPGVGVTAQDEEQAVAVMDEVVVTATGDTLGAASEFSEAAFAAIFACI